MRIGLLVFTLIYLGNISAQSMIQTGVLPCSYELHYTGSGFADCQFDSYDQFVYDYVSRNFPDSKEYIILSKTNLRELHRKGKSQTRLSFCKRVKKQGKINVEIFSKVEQLNVNLDSIDADEYIFFQNAFEDLLGNEFFGYVERKKSISFKRLETINVSTKNWDQKIDHDFLKEFINPNLINSKQIEKPAQVFYDEEKEAVYIYIFGNLPYQDDIAEIEEQKLFDSYVVKIIVTQNNVHKVVLPSKYLIAFGWLECSYFWPL